MPSFVSSDQCDGDLKTRIGRCLNYLSCSIDPSLRSIAFTALGTGGLRYPADVTAKYMFKHVEDYILDTSNVLKRISFVVYPADTKTVQGFNDNNGFFQFVSFLFIYQIVSTAFDLEFNQMRAKYASKLPPVNPKPIPAGQSSLVPAPQSIGFKGWKFYLTFPLIQLNLSAVFSR